MKRNLFYLLPFLLILGAACSPKSNVTPVLAPTGTFQGTFGALLKKSVGYDTIRDTITLKMTSSFTYAVVGDTAKVHGGSKGTFAYNGYYIQFNDSTKVVTGSGAKFHLKGVYQYGYDGISLGMERDGASGSDTLALVYNLKKIN